MSLRNFICESCEKRRVCGIVPKLDKFSDSAKKDLGVSLTMDDCADYKEDQE